MKVLTVVPGLDPPRGGMATATTRITLSALATGIECTVAVPNQAEHDPGSQALVEELRDAGVVVHQFPTLSVPAGPAYRWGLSRAQAVWIARNVSAFDVVHVHGVWGVGQLAALMASRRQGIPVVVSAHESLTEFDIEDSRSSMRRRQKLLMKAIFVKYASMFVFASDLESNDSMPGSPRARTVNYPLVKAHWPVPVLRERGDQPELVLGFLARIHPKKNLDLIIEALSELPGHVRLLVAGSGSELLGQRLRRQAEELGVADRIIWLGFVAPSDRSAFLGKIDLLVMPSDFESFGLSAAEAMWEGVPVMVSNKTGVGEVMDRHGGGRVVAAHVGPLVTAISELDANRTELNAMGAAGQRGVLADLTYERTGAALRAAYEELLDPKW